MLKPFEIHGWSARITCETGHMDCLEITAVKGSVTTRIAALHSSDILSACYSELSTRVDHVFFRGQPFMFGTFASEGPVPVEPLSDFMAFLIALNKRLEPDCSPAVRSRKTVTVRRLTAENPLGQVFSRLQQFTSVVLAEKLVRRRSEFENVTLADGDIKCKATGIAFLMRNALDYLVPPASDKLNRRVLGLYYGSIALAQAEMLASPSGPSDLDEVEKMTRGGHGLFTLAGPSGRFSELRVGVLPAGFFRDWTESLGNETSDYPESRPKSEKDLQGLPPGTWLLLPDLFASMPEIDDLFFDVFDGMPRWIGVAHRLEANHPTAGLTGMRKKVESTYVQLSDRSGRICAESLESAGWPLAEVRQVGAADGSGNVFQARVDHAGYASWHSVLPLHSSPFGNSSTLLLPTVGNLRDYRTIAVATLYALSIMVRYMPSAWRRVEGGDEDQYLALVEASLAVWERVLPEQFLESIGAERVRTAQPGSFFA